MRQRWFVLAMITGWFFSMYWPAQAAEITSLLNRAGAAEKSGNYAAALEALEQAIDQVRLQAPLTVKPFLLVTRPAKHYGDYAPRENAVFRGGEPQQFYMEPKNLVYPRTAAGTYEPNFEVDLQILAAGGKVVVNQEKFASFNLPTKSQTQDIFVNLKVTLSGAPPGDYRVQFVVRDKNSKKSATVTQPITLK